jgi:Suppressor of fused protein (SUFU)
MDANLLPADDTFAFDVRRTLLLGHMAAAWGLPQTRAIYSKGSDRVETYSFPPRHAQDAYRFATVGVSALSFPAGRPIPFELMTLLPPDLAGAERKTVMDILMDIALHLQDRGEDCTSATTLRSVPQIPPQWNKPAVLLDAPLFETTDMGPVLVGKESVAFVCAFFLARDEYEFIAGHSVSAFLDIVEKSSETLLNPFRSSFAAGPETSGAADA